MVRLVVFDLIRREVLVSLMAIGLAFNAFQDFDDFLRFCQWLAPYINLWRHYVHSFWDLMLAWLPIPPPIHFKDFLTSLVFSFVVILRSDRISSNMLWRNGINEVKEFLAQPIASFMYRTRIISSGLVMLFIVAPVFGVDPVDNSPKSAGELLDKLFFTLSYIAKISFPIVIVFYIFIPPIDEPIKSQLSRTLISSAFWRTTFFIVTLLAINFIGLAADRSKSIQSASTLTKSQLEIDTQIGRTQVVKTAVKLPPA